MLAEALVIIDLQNGVCYDGKQEIDHLETLIGKVQQRIRGYHEAGRPIIFVQHNDEELVAGSKDWQVIPQLDTSLAWQRIQKTHANSFFHTELEDILRAERISSLEICGAQTQYCIDTTVKFAHGLGYRLYMGRGMSTTYDNDFMSAAETISFYENIWQDRFLTFL